VSPRERAAACYAAAELASHPRDRAALKAAAAAWERIAGPGVAWGTKRLESDLLKLRIDCVAYQGPFQAPQPPKAPPPNAVAPNNAHPYLSDSQLYRQTVAKLQETTIEF
jgi:hypothetical protein